MGQKPFPLSFAPGVQRDGTNLDGDQYLDAQWCRWRLGRPRKMGGYQEITNAVPGIGRRIHFFYTGGLNYIHVGHARGILQVVIDNDGNLISKTDRTPKTFQAGIDPGWTMDAIFDTTSSSVQLVAQSNPDISVLSNAVTSSPFIGEITATTKLAVFGAPPDTFGGNYAPPLLSGGIFCTQPFVFGFGSDGQVSWSAPNLPLTLGVNQGTSGAGSARISAQKVVAGMALRGGGAQSPAALMWTLSEVISASFIGSSGGEFSFNTVSPSSSILSSNCVVEYDGLYFWAGIDRFMVFNGTVSEVPNKLNQDWFFDNMNWRFSAKTFAFKVPRYGEIWFCAPLFGNTEPSHAVIYNVRENTWYDTLLPNGGRSAAFYAQGFRFPIMSGTEPNQGSYSLWMHENGMDQVDQSGKATAITSYFQTPMFGGPKSDPASDQGLSIQQVEADIIQTGDMTVQVKGQANVRAPIFTSDPVALVAIPQKPQEQMVSFTQNTNYRIRTMLFTSSVLGGNYIMGRSLMHVLPTDMRMTS